MFVNHEKKFVYLALPKTGSYSIHAYFDYTQGHPEPDEHHAGVRELPPELSDYYKFAFIRNPWSKLVSVYHDFTLRRGKQYSGLVTMDEPLLSEFEDFEDFCLRLGESHWFTDVFFRPQASFVYDNTDKPIDYIGRFESINIDFKHICREFGMPVVDLGHENRGKYLADYRSYYTDDSSEAVRRLYEEDIRRFGYEF